MSVSSTDSVHLSSTVFQHLQITPYSSFFIAIRYVLQCRFEPNSFEQLQLGDFVHFSLLIESADSVYLGIDLFAYLNQATGSQFSFQLDQVGMSADTVNDYEDYYEAYDTEYEPIDKEAADWFCIPSGLFKNAQLAQSAVAMVQLSRFESSISVSGQAFNDIELGDNAKLQVTVYRFYIPKLFYFFKLLLYCYRCFLTLSKDISSLIQVPFISFASTKEYSRSGSKSIASIRPLTTSREAVVNQAPKTKLQFSNPAVAVARITKDKSCSKRC